MSSLLKIYEDIVDQLNLKSALSAAVNIILKKSALSTSGKGFLNTPIYHHIGVGAHNAKSVSKITIAGVTGTTGMGGHPLGVQGVMGIPGPQGRYGHPVFQELSQSVQIENKKLMDQIYTEIDTIETGYRWASKSWAQENIGASEYPLIMSISPEATLGFNYNRYTGWLSFTQKFKSTKREDYPGYESIAYDLCFYDVTTGERQLSARHWGTDGYVGKIPIRTEMRVDTLICDQSPHDLLWIPPNTDLETKNLIVKIDALIAKKIRRVSLALIDELDGGI